MRRGVQTGDAAQRARGACWNWASCASTFCSRQDDPTRFVLVEIYRDAEAAAAHKETAHYPVWRDAVAPMMAEPRHEREVQQGFPR